MFDLERAIGSWRREMKARLPLRREAVRELEAHLRDAVQTGVEKGMTLEEAWTAAVAEFGTPEAVATEFEKLPLDRRHWLPAQVVLGCFAAFILLAACFVVAQCLFGHANLLLGVHVFAVTTGYVGLFAAGSIAAWSAVSRAVCGWSPVETTLLRATLRFTIAWSLSLVVLGVALGAIWARMNLGRYWAWDPKEIGGAAIVIWGAVALATTMRRNGERSAMAPALLGSIIVALGWFGPVFVPGGPLHDYTGNRGAIALGIFALTIVQTALIALTLAPRGCLRFGRSDVN